MPVRFRPRAPPLQLDSTKAPNTVKKHAWLFQRLAMSRRTRSGIRAIAAALLAKRSLTGGEADRIFNRASWPAAALKFEVTNPLTLRD